MVIVLPLSKRDLNLAVPLMSWIRKLGSYPRHDLLLAYSSELTALERETVASTARAIQWRVPPVAITVGIDVQEWPQAPNQIFRSVVNAAKTMNRPWLFLEPDCTPIRRGWADDLADAYNRLRMPFMGVVDTTYAVTPSKELVKTGEHLCGCAVYPPNLAEFTQRHTICHEAFDHAIAKDVRPKAANCPLMQDNWSTGNYCRDGEKTVCDPVTLRIELIGRSITRPLRPEVVLLHGCKDGSLLRLLRDEMERKELEENLLNSDFFDTKAEEKCGQRAVFT